MTQQMSRPIKPAITVPDEHESHANNYRTGCLAGRAGTPALPREWFKSDAAFEAYVAGWEKGNEERLEWYE